jgi:hypothetical protein
MFLIFCYTTILQIYTIQITCHNNRHDNLTIKLRRGRHGDFWLTKLLSTQS